MAQNIILVLYYIFLPIKRSTSSCLCGVPPWFDVLGDFGNQSNLFQHMPTLKSRNVIINGCIV